MNVAQASCLRQARRLRYGFTNHLGLLYYRDGDNDVGLRLRSWRPLGEVLLPWELRQTLAKEVEEEAKLYEKINETMRRQ